MAFGAVMAHMTLPNGAEADRLAQYYDTSRPTAGTRYGRVFLLFGPVLALVVLGVAIITAVPYAADYPIFMSIFVLSVFAAFPQARGRVKIDLADLCGMIVFLAAFLLV